MTSEIWHKSIKFHKILSTIRISCNDPLVEMYTNWCLLPVYVLSLEVMCNADLVHPEVEIVFLCEDGMTVNCSSVAEQALPLETKVHGTTVIVKSVLLKSRTNFFWNLAALNEYAMSTNQIGLLIGVGSGDVINAVTCVAEQFNLPAVTYITDHHRTSIFENTSVDINPQHAGIARALLTIVGKAMSKNTFVICEESHVTDGFFDVLANTDSQISNHQSHVTLVSACTSDHDLELKLRAIHDNGFRIIVVHSSQNILDRVLTVANSLSYIKLGYAWIVTEKSLPDNFVECNKSHMYPEGLLAIEGYEIGMVDGLLRDTIQVYRQELMKLTQPGAVTDTSHDISSFRMDSTYTRTILRGIKTNPILFDNMGRRKHMTFRLLNYVQDGAIPEWRDVGYIKDDHLNLDTVVWPGQSIFGPTGLIREFYTIATRSAEPFMYIWGPIESASECAGAVQCIQVFTHDPLVIKEAVSSFRENVPPDNVTFTVHCCEGVVVDVLNQLVSELDFDYLLYFQNDSSIGHFRNGSWNGMIGDVLNGAADIMAGAISVTSERVKGVTFTEPFYYSSFNMISSSTEKTYSLLAFTKPFDTTVWIMIVLSANVTAVVTSLFEWNSPFGLNPWGKCRKRNYTLGSALTMVYSIWFGHTVSTKSPKSWPSKFLQNIWAVMSIFILASYTANLAAFLAGNTAEDLTYNILDSKLSSKKIGVVKLSAAELHVKEINVELHSRLAKYHVTDVQEGMRKIRSNQLEFYMDDTPLLEYALSRFDDNCSLKYALHSFGENAYAFAVKPGSYIKSRFDPLIMNYMELDLTEALRWRYMGKGRYCENQRMDSSDLQFGLPHTAGLFVMLLVAVGLSFIVLIIEHVLYFAILPWLRKKPQMSIWKSRNVEYASQRIYRAIHSEKVTPTTQVMVSKVKQKRNELQSKLKRQMNNGSTISLPSYQSVITRLPGFANAELYNSRSYPTMENIYQISGAVSETIREEEDDALDDLYLSITHLHEGLVDNEHRSTSRASCSGHDNPGFESDEDLGDIVIHDNSRPLITKKRSQSERLSCIRPVRKLSQRVGVVSSKLDRSGRGRYSVSGASPVQADRRYETWPSPKQRKRSLKRLKNNHPTVSFSNTDKLIPNMSSRIVNEIQSSTAHRKCSAVSLDCYHEKRSNMDLKDNRIKSDLRHHAMAYRRGPSLSVDESAVEALSKEDLLVLWKRSEIELQTKLNRIIHQNSHLRRLVNIVEENSNGGNSGTAGNETTTGGNPPEPDPSVIISTQL